MTKTLLVLVDVKKNELISIWEKMKTVLPDAAQRAALYYLVLTIGGIFQVPLRMDGAVVFGQ